MPSARGTRRGFRSYILTPVWVCGLIACASGIPGVYLAEGAPASAQLSSMLLLPANFDLPMPQQLVPGKQLLAEALAIHLRAAGHPTVRVALPEVQVVWRIAVERVGGRLTDDAGNLLEQRYERARGLLASELLSKHEADAVVMPTLFTRKAHYVGRFLRWDGVSRPVRVHSQNTAAVVDTIYGDDVASSLRVSVFDVRGSKIFERYAGIEPLVEYTHTGGFSNELSTGRILRRLRTDLFQDKALVSESARLALTPWIEAPADRVR